MNKSHIISKTDFLEKYLSHNKPITYFGDIDNFNKTSCFNNTASKIVCNLTNSNRKVELNSTVNFYKQEYLIGEDNESYLTDNSYNNKKKIIINNAKYEDKLIRECLLECYDDSINVFILNSNTSEFVKELIDVKINLYTKKVKKELKLNKSNENLEENNNNYNATIDNLMPKFKDLYVVVLFVSSIENVINNKLLGIDLNDLNKEEYLNNFLSLIDLYNNDIKYYIKKNNLNKSISLCNTAKDNVINMKKTTKEILSESEYTILVVKIKPIFMNLSKCYLDKHKNNIGININNKFEYVYKTIKLIENDFFSYYKDDKDIQNLKMYFRLLNCYILIKDVDKFESLVKIINGCKIYSRIISDDNDIKISYQSLLNEFKNIKNTKNLSKTLKYNVNNLYSCNIKQDNSMLKWTKCSDKPQFNNLNNILKSLTTIPKDDI